MLIKPPESTHDVLTTDHPPGVKQLCDQGADGVTNIGWEADITDYKCVFLASDCWDKEF